MTHHLSGRTALFPHIFPSLGLYDFSWRDVTDMCAPRYVRMPYQNTTLQKSSWWAKELILLVLGAQITQQETTVKPTPALNDDRMKEKMLHFLGSLFQKQIALWAECILSQQLLLACNLVEGRYDSHDFCLNLKLPEFPKHDCISFLSLNEPLFSPMRDCSNPQEPSSLSHTGYYVLFPLK